VKQGRDGLLVAVGAGLTLIILLVLQSSIGSGLLGTRTETSTVTSTQTIQPPQNPAISQWFYDLGGRDVTDLANMYSQNAVVTWTNEGGPLTGTYPGRDNITTLFGDTIGRETNVTATIANYNLTVINPTETNATFSLTVNGTSPLAGDFLFKVNVSQEWNYSAVSGEVGQGQWQIVKENWDFMTCDGQYPAGFCY
jgi:hypothetical protein